MRIKKHLISPFLMALMAVPLVFGAGVTAADAGSGSSHAKMSNAGAKSGPDIVDTAVAAGGFETLVAAVQAAGLVEALKGDGPFTVFAPNDEAFAALPPGTVDNLLEPENRDQLVAILTYHVVPGRVDSKTAAGLDNGSTLNGQRVDLQFANGQLTVAGANVIAADIETSNGLIHVIDRVILPAQDDLLETASKAGSFKILGAALDAAELLDALSADGPFTVFAPTDDAFAALPAGTLQDLLKPENRDQLVSILTYHVVAGRVYADQALNAGRAETLETSEVEVALRGGRAQVNDANIVATDIEASNGVIHVIDKVLLPSRGEDRADAAMDIIQTAIRTGAPLYNDGQRMACTAIYEVTAKCLLALDSVASEDKRTLRRALAQMDEVHGSSRKAWVLRDALDKVYASLDDKQMAVR